jgi:glycosyltransferase involved in cell wall biosynthesis
MTDALPRVTVLVPCRNEERYIGACLDSILGTNYPADRLEILVIDGRSSDRTRDIVQQYVGRDPRIRLVDNPKQIVPTALNAGIRLATGEVVVRMDAHVVYPASYITRLVTALGESGADNVGGRLITVASGDGPMARAIAIAQSHPLGVGNAHYRLGPHEDQRWVDTVPFGCYRREVFGRIGGFDEDMVRNQDDEFNARLIRQGGKVLLLADLTARYYARPTLRKLAQMYFQYGLFKPLVARKVGRVMTARQLVPAGFVLALALTLSMALLWPGAAWALGVLAVVYGAAVIGSSVPYARDEGVPCALALMIVFPTLHVSYGVGFWRGIWRAVFHRTAVDPAAVPLSR